MIPTLNDTQENLAVTAAFVKSLAGEPLLNILPYHNYGEMKYEQVGETYSLKDIPLPKKEYLDGVREILDGTGVKYAVGGYNIGI